jgi:enamine deaminase RidA (YjgF/YER057c/UK114 family)
MIVMEPINPPALGAPRGYTNGLLVPAGWRVLFIAGQTAADAEGRVAEPGFVQQFQAALDKTLTVVRAAGGSPEHVARMTVYVTDMAAYRGSRACLGEIWRNRMGRHYPVMALLGVSQLVDEAATVEIEATAVVPG